MSSLATSGGAERQLVYRNWVESRRAFVDSISGGRLGYVHLLRGQAGGLKLAKPASAIRLGAVVRKTEPSMALVECFDPQNNTCPITPACALKGILSSAQDAFLAVIDRYTLADAIKQRSQLANLLELRLSASAAR